MSPFQACSLVPCHPLFWLLLPTSHPVSACQPNLQFLVTHCSQSGSAAVFEPGTHCWQDQPGRQDSWESGGHGTGHLGGKHRSNKGPARTQRPPQGPCFQPTVYGLELSRTGIGLEAEVLYPTCIGLSHIHKVHGLSL